MSQIPIDWLMKIEGFEEKPEKQQVSMMIDGINQLPAPLFLPGCVDELMNFIGDYTT